MKTVGPVLFSLGLTAACVFGAAGRVNWVNAWVLIGLSLVGGVAFTAGRDRELSAERRNVEAGKSWDKVLVGITVLLGPMAVWITAGLDVRFRWSGGMPVAVSTVGAGTALAATGLIAWAMRSNKFFSAVVRIQKDRGHVVVDRGPYALVRHPGYAGMLVFGLATPVILGSYCAMGPAVLTGAFLVARTAMEDVALRRELEGYAEYTDRVRFRLVPGIW